MVLVTHHTQSSYVAVPVRTLLWNRGLQLKHNGIRFQTLSQKDRSISIKHASLLRSAPLCVHDAKGKPSQISSFKGNARNDEGGDSSKSIPKKSVKVSFVPHDRDKTLVESPTPPDMPISSASDSKKTLSGSVAILKLFTKWLDILHTGAPNGTEKEILETSAEIELPQDSKATNAKESGEILKVVLCYFLGLDASITIPLIIFVPLYLAVNVMYGVKVSRELTPLWVIGPLIVALYVKLLRGIFALYVFTFKHTVKLVKNLPTYCSITWKYIAEGKLKAEIKALLLQPVVKLKNIDYKELSMRKWKALQEWLTEKYLDFVESIWPYYCRTIRFLKRANLI